MIFNSEHTSQSRSFLSAHPPLQFLLTGRQRKTGMINSRRVGKGLIPPIQSLLHLILWTHTRTHLAYAHRPTCASVTHMPTTPGNQKKTFTKQECPILEFPSFPSLYTCPIVIKIDPFDSAELRSLASDSRESNIGQTKLHPTFSFQPPLPPNSSRPNCLHQFTYDKEH